MGLSTRRFALGWQRHIATLGLLEISMDKLEAIARAHTEKDSDALRSALSDDEEDIGTAPLLAQLLLEDWHDSHEDIVFELGLLGAPSSVDAITKAATIPFEHLVLRGKDSSLSLRMTLIQSFP